MDMDEWMVAWTKAFTDAGHEFEHDEDGDIHWFVVDAGFHNGPRCSKCGWDCCMHCTDMKSIPQCTETARCQS